MKTLILSLLILAACSSPSDPIQPDPDPVTTIAYNPSWPVGKIGGLYEAKGFSIDDDSLYQSLDAGGHRSYPIEIRRNGNEVWYATPDRALRFQGVLSATLSGTMIRYNNGRPQVHYPITFHRVQ